MSSKSPINGRKPSSQQGTKVPGVEMSPEERQRWDVVARAHELVAQMTKMSLNIPEKVQQTLIDVYMSINNSLISTLAKAETAIAEAQDRSKSSSASPFINTALENLKHATTELTNVMKKVSDLLETMNTERQNGETGAGVVKEPKKVSRFSFKQKRDGN